MKLKLLLLLTICSCSLFSYSSLDFKDDETFYTSLEFIDNKISLFGGGIREMKDYHCFDANISFAKPYRYKGMHLGRFYPIILSLNYHYFLDRFNCYIGGGYKMKLDFSKEDFIPAEFNPCITWGFLTNVGKRPCFIEFKNNFFRSVSLLSSYNDLKYDKSYEKQMFRSSYYSIAIGAFF